MRLARRTSLAGLAIAVLFSTSAQSQALRLTPDHANGYYQAGESVRWQVTADGSGSNEISYVVKQGGLTEIAKGKLLLASGTGEIDSCLTNPGTLLVEASVADATGGIIRALSGAVFSGDKIQPSAPRPADFDSFWQAKLDELSKVPTNVVLTAISCVPTNVDYWQISMDNIRGSHIRGQLARPKQGEHLPALLIVQWAGVYGLPTDWITGYATNGWLVLNINPHDLPIDQSAAFYKEQRTGVLKDYPAIGNDDREKSYFLRMYLSCYRAADYLAHRPDWDGKTLVVTGGSQGGLQSFVTAALCPRITALLASVPAGCDMLGPDVGRAPGWPMWYNAVNGKATNAVHEASRYYDVVNFASRITCSVLVGVGMIDQTCPPAGVFAAFNQVMGPKEIVLLPKAGHGEINHSHAAYSARFNAWLNALRQDQPVPVQGH